MPHVALSGFVHRVPVQVDDLVEVPHEDFGHLRRGGTAAKTIRKMLHTHKKERRAQKESRINIRKKQLR